MTYLDWAAAAPQNQNAHDEASRISRKLFANPSAPHIEGKKAKSHLEEARERIAHVIGCKSSEVYFTSGATEANNIVITSMLIRQTKGSVITSAFEHASIYEPCKLLEKQGHDVKYIHADMTGRIDSHAVRRHYNPNTALLALMHVNNVTGSIQPINDIINDLRQTGVTRRRVHVHCDMAQSVGKLPVRIGDYDLDSATISGYKFGAPRGVGILVLRRSLESIYRGGSQELRIRPGTENLYGAWALMRALESAYENLEADLARAQTIKEQVIETCSHIHGLEIIHGVMCTDANEYSPYIAAISLPGVPSEVLVRVLGDKGYIVGSGAACSANRKMDSRVLSSFGYNDRITSTAIRISWGPETEPDSVENFLVTLALTAKQMRGSQSS